MQALTGVLIHTCGDLLLTCVSIFIIIRKGFPKRKAKITKLLASCVIKMEVFSVSIKYRKL